jgi:NCS2 family nucleobase:cation symporter-2
VVLTLGLMVAFNVWGKGIWRILSPLIGMAAGCIGALATGIVDATTFAPLLAAPSFHVPSLAHAGWTFEIGFVVPFTIAAVAACLRATGDLTTCQKINDADWKRPDLKTLSRGALANGLATAAGGLVGTLGVNTFTNGVGLSSATGLASRRIAYPIGAAFVALAFLPKVGALLLVMPAPVLGAVLWFSAAFVLVNGLQIVMSRMFDTRRTLVFGLSFTIALSVDLYPSVFASAPVTVQPITGSALVLGMVVALVLNAVFRVGVRRTQAITVLPEEIDPETVTEFMNRQGATWGARRDVIERATFNLLQSLDTIASLSKPAAPIAVEASFDEFHVDLRVAYDGPQLELPTERPSPEEIMGSVAGEQRLAGFMLRRLADKVTTSMRGTQSVLTFRFDH